MHRERIDRVMQLIAADFKADFKPTGYLEADLDVFETACLATEAGKLMSARLSVFLAAAWHYADTEDDDDSGLAFIRGMEVLGV
jgi:hypothetical protein